MSQIWVSLEVEENKSLSFCLSIYSQTNGPWKEGAGGLKAAQCQLFIVKPYVVI